MTQIHLLILFLAAIWAGAQNQLAGGGSFITLPALMLTGLDARAANITSTLALFPGQIAGGWIGRRSAGGTANLTLRALIMISLVGGAIGAGLLLLTPSNVFAKMVPWLVLFATCAFAWGSFFRRPAPEASSASGLQAPLAGALQFVIAIYGGYFGGGIGFLMMAALALSNVSVRTAAATKNLLAAVMNCTAVVVLALYSPIHWLEMSVTAVGAVTGSWIGAHMLTRIDERKLRLLVVGIGAALTVGLFLKAR